MDNYELASAKPRAGLRVLLAGAVMLAGGCDTAPSAPPAPEHSAPPAAACVDLNVPFEDGVPVGVTSEQAKRCAEAMLNGRLALVVFDGVNATGAELGTAAEAAENNISAYTEELFTISADVVEASDEAESKWKENLGESDCVDHEKHKPAARVADEAMPELWDYDFLVALTPQGHCSDNIHGLTNSGRHADLYMGTKYWSLPALRAEKGKAIGFGTAHEFLHEVGLHHDDELQTWMPFIDFGGVLDFHELVTQKRTNLIDRPNSLAGANVRLDHIIPNPIHLDRLRWPQRVLNGDKPYASPVTPESGAALSSAAYDGQFFAVPLAEPLTLDATGTKYDTLVVVPRRLGVGEGFYGFTICLANGSKTLWINSIVTQDTRKTNDTMVLDAGSQSLEIKIGQGGESMTARVV